MDKKKSKKGLINRDRGDNFFSKTDESTIVIEI